MPMGKAWADPVVMRFRLIYVVSCLYLTLHDTATCQWLVLPVFFIYLSIHSASGPLLMVCAHGLLKQLDRSWDISRKRSYTHCASQDVTVTHPKVSC